MIAGAILEMRTKTWCSTRRSSHFVFDFLAIGKILRELCKQQGVELVEGHAMVDHVHLCLSVPPKFSVANTVGFLKGKSAIRIHREYMGKVRPFTGFHFWARGYCVSRVGLDEKLVRRYIRNQEEEGKKEEMIATAPAWLGSYIIHLLVLPSLTSGGIA